MESGNDYVIQVKGNQPTLHKAIQLVLDTQQAQDEHISLEKNRGRLENRDVSIYKVDSEKGPFVEWSALSTIIHVHSYGLRNSKSYDEHRYYISSKENMSAQYFAEGIRSHWGIENRLHWVKDVILNEDNSGIKSGRIATNLSLFKSALITLFRLNGYESIKYAMERFANRPDKAMQLLENNHI